jgi:hypothetical protein
MSLLLFYTNNEGTRVSITPRALDVAALLRARTRADGQELGRFTAATRPTEAEADRLIDMAALQLSAIVGQELPEALAASAKQAVLLRAAMLIEGSYFPEQIGSGDSMFLQLRELADAQAAALASAINENQPGQARAYTVPIQSPTYDPLNDLLFADELLP